MKLKIAGSGGMFQIPNPFCKCPICEEARIKRGRYERLGPSLYIEDIHMLIDTPEDIAVACDRQGISKIEYPMLADPTHALSKDFEVLIEEDGLAERGTFVVNPEGKIVAYEVNAGNVGRNADELLRKVQACQFVYTHGDEVCPAKWEPGKETLKPS